MGNRPRTSAPSVCFPSQDEFGETIIYIIKIQCNSHSSTHPLANQNMQHSPGHSPVFLLRFSQRDKIRKIAGVAFPVIASQVCLVPSHQTRLAEPSVKTATQPCVLRSSSSQRTLVMAWE